MSTRFGLFSDSLLGPGLGLEGGGRTLATIEDSTDLDRMGLSDIAVETGIHLAEFVPFGDAEDITVVFGIHQPTSALDQMVGASAEGIGWRLDTGDIIQDGIVIATGLPVPERGAVVGVVLDLSSSAAAALTFKLGQQVVHTEPMTLGDAWHFAVTVAAPKAGGNRVFVNAGQNTFRDTRGILGWTEAVESTGVLRLATEDYITAPGDRPANTRWAGVIASTGLLEEQGLDFPLWRRDPGMTVGKLDIHDAAGRYQTLLDDDWHGAPVSVLRVRQGEPLSSAETVGHYVVERVDVLDDGHKVIVLRDGLQAWELPLQRDIYPPTVPELAYLPLPVLEGAARSVPALIVPSTSVSELTAYVSDQPVTVAGVRDMGDLLNPGAEPPDWTYDVRRTGAVLRSPPFGVVTVDASTVGAIDTTGDPPPAPEDVFDGAGNPFAGVDDSAPTGWDVGATDAGDTPSKQTVVGHADIGGLPVSAVCAYPNGPTGAIKWLRLGQLAPGVQYRLVLRARLSNGAVFARPPLNPDFEVGDAGWEKQTGWSIVQGGTRRGGLWSARYVGGGGPASLVNDIRVPVQPGRTLSASCWVNQLGQSGTAAARVGLHWFNGAGQFVGDVYGNLVNKKSGTGWHRSSVSGSAPAGAVFASLALSANADSGRTIWADDFEWSYTQTGQARRIFVATAPSEASALDVIETTGAHELPLINTTGQPQDVYLCCTCDGTGGDLDLAYLASAELWDVPAPMLVTAEPVPEKLAPVLSSLARRGGVSFRVEDATAIDDATGYAGLGFWTQDAGLSVGQAFDLALSGYCAARWQDDTGEVRIARLIDPDDVDPDAWAFDLNEGHMERPVGLTSDDAPGLSATAWYQLNYRVLQRGEIVTDYDAETGVPEAVRQQLIHPGRGRVGSAVPVAPRYRRADLAAPMLLNLDRREDAQAELDRRRRLYRVPRRFYQVTMRRQFERWPLGVVGRLTYPAHGLQEGRAVLLARRARNNITGEVTLWLWGS